jgi:hypothetical protein
MKAVAIAAGVVLNTLLLTAALLWTDPFARINLVLDAAFSAAPKWTQVTNLARDPRIQDIYHGEHPFATFQRAAEYWRTQPGKRRVILVGNSQMFSLSLAPGEVPQTTPEHTYPDLVMARLQSDGMLTYRLAAPGLSYSEALFEINYLLTHPDLRPSLVLLQMNYQTFWNGGIRESLLELLDDGNFRQQVRHIALSGKPYADDFASAVRRYEEGVTQAGTPRREHQDGFGSSVENLARHELSGVAVLQRSREAKDSFEEMLYRARIYFLRIKPSNARSIMGPQLTRSQAAVEAIAESCGNAGVRLAMFTAPVNPAVSLYRSPEDKSRFQTFVRTIADRYRVPVADLESSVAAELWGRQLNGPDPLHMGRAAHVVVAGQVSSFTRNALEAQ